MIRLKDLAVREPGGTKKEMDLGLVIAQFCYVFGSAAFQSGDVGWLEFWNLYIYIPNILALQRWNMTQAVGLGGALVMSGKDDVKSLIEKDRQEAFLS